jgi:hypothetical protein
MNTSKSIRTFLSGIMLAATLLISGVSFANPPVTKDGVTTINLTEYNGYFAADETLAALKPGKYRINVTNKADKLVGFLLQDGVTHEQLDMFPLEPGQTRSTTFTVTENGFRYRCPINPTPWYDVSASN